MKKLAGANTNHVLRITKDRCFERSGRLTEQHCDLVSHSTSLSKYSQRRWTAQIPLRRPLLHCVLYPQTSSGESLAACVCVGETIGQSQASTAFASWDSKCIEAAMPCLRSTNHTSRPMEHQQLVCHLRHALFVIGMQETRPKE